MFTFLLCTIQLLLFVSIQESNFLVNAHTGEDCNEFVCGSVVSKCLLTKSCQCTLSNCHCCEDCINCLGDLYMECCDCLGLCPVNNETRSGMTVRSQIGDFEGVSELFDTLTADENDEQWTMIRFPIRPGNQRRGGAGGVGVSPNYGFPISMGGSKKSLGRITDAIDRHASVQKKPTPVVFNCTLIFLNVCQNTKKCRQYCESMGSVSFRWFHDGCCQCVGAHCPTYGINESRCSECPEEDFEIDEEDADYGESEEDMNREEGQRNYSEDEINYN